MELLKEETANKTVVPASNQESKAELPATYASVFIRGGTAKEQWQTAAVKGKGKKVNSKAPKQANKALKPSNKDYHLAFSQQFDQVSPQKLRQKSGPVPGSSPDAEEVEGVKCI